MQSPHNIYLQLRKVEDDLLRVVDAGNNTALEDVAFRMDALLLEVNNAVKGDCDILPLIYKVACNISLIANGFMDVEVEAENSDAVLQRDLTDIFCELVLTEEAPVDPSSAVRDKLSASPSPSQWLLAHLHNPYPSVADKKSFSYQSGRTVKSVEDLFTNARRKIGWTAFSKRHFKGNRTLTLDCANRVLVEGEREGAFCTDIVRDLDEVKATAQRLYGNSDSTEPSSFAKELESIEAQIATKASKRRFSSTSTSSKQSSTTSTSTLSTSSSRKRSRASSEEPDATSHSEDPGALSSRPVKRGRSISSTRSSQSQESTVPSSTACSSESNETLNELVTPTASPTASPTHSKLPLDLFDGWIDGVSTQPAFLPPDLADKPPQSVLSQKRASPDSDSNSDAPSKRARLDEARIQAVPDENDNGRVSESGPCTESTQSGPTLPSDGPEVDALSENPVALPAAAQATAEQPTPELDEAAVNEILSHLDFSIPQPPVPIWDEALLNGTFEANMFGLAPIGMGTASCSGLPDDIDAILAKIPVPDAPQHVAQQEGANAFMDSFLPCDSDTDVDNTVQGLSALPEFPGFVPISFTSSDFSFLENLGNTPYLPEAQSSSVQEVLPATLIDVGSYSTSDRPELNDLEREKKLERMNQLLAEARMLQQEVFG